MLLHNEIMTNERGRTRSKHAAVMYSYQMFGRHAERREKVEYLGLFLYNKTN